MEFYNYEFKAKNVHLKGFDIKYEIDRDERGRIIVYKNGIKHLIDVNTLAFSFSSQVQLTKHEALEIIKGTKGFEISKGDFKEEVYLYDLTKYKKPTIEELHVGLEIYVNGKMQILSAEGLQAVLSFVIKEDTINKYGWGVAKIDPEPIMIKIK